MVRCIGNPDALPPTTVVGRFLVKLRAVFRFFGSDEGIFSLRFAVVSGCRPQCVTRLLGSKMEIGSCGRLLWCRWAAGGVCRRPGGCFCRSLSFVYMDVICGTSDMIWLARLRDSWLGCWGRLLGCSYSSNACITADITSAQLSIPYKGLKVKYEVIGLTLMCSSELRRLIDAYFNFCRGFRCELGLMSDRDHPSWFPSLVTSQI